MQHWTNGIARNAENVVIECEIYDENEELAERRRFQLRDLLKTLSIGLPLPAAVKAGQPGAI